MSKVCLTSFWTVFFGFMSCQAFSGELSQITVEQIKPINYFFTKAEMERNSFHEQGEQIAQQLAFTIAKETPSTIWGGFTYVFEGISAEQAEKEQKVVAKLGWPLESRLGPNEVAEPNDFQVLHEMKCFCALYEGQSDGVVEAWRSMMASAKSKGYSLTGEARTRIKLSSQTGYIIAQLQLGIL